MLAMDIGESLVGAYLRHIVKCEVVIYNGFFTDRQGEIDVVALSQGKSREVCNARGAWEGPRVATRLSGLISTGSRFSTLTISWRPYTPRAKWCEWIASLWL